LRDEVEDDEEGAGHGAEGEEALGEVADSLFDDVVDDTGCFAFVGFVWAGDLAGDAEGFCVERGLGDKAVGEGYAEKAGDEGCKTEEEDVPMEAGWFTQGSSLPWAMREDTGKSHD